MRERGRGRERWLYLVAPNKATLAFQDERQVYRRKFMRAELQRVELDLREGRVGEGREREAAEKEE